MRWLSIWLSISSLFQKEAWHSGPRRPVDTWGRCLAHFTVAAASKHVWLVAATQFAPLDCSRGGDNEKSDCRCAAINVYMCAGGSAHEHR